MTMTRVVGWRQVCLFDGVLLWSLCSIVMPCCRCKGSDGGSDSGIGIGGCSGDLAGTEEPARYCYHLAFEFRQTKCHLKQL